MALHISRADDKLITKAIQDRIADGSIVAAPATGETNPGIVTAPSIGLNTVAPQPKPGVQAGAQHPAPLPVIRDPKTPPPPVTIGRTMSIKDVLTELAERGQAPASVGKCRVPGCGERGWIEDEQGWLCVHCLHSHRLHPLPKPSPQPVKRVEDAPKAPPGKSEPPEQTMPAPKSASHPVLMLPAPQIAGLLPAGEIAISKPPAEETAVPTAVETQIITFPSERVAGAEREVNPLWVAAFKAAHGKRGTEAIKALINGGTPEAYTERVKGVETATPESAKPSAANFETHPKIAPIVIESVDTMPGLMPVTPYAAVASDVETAYQRRIDTVRRMAAAERAVA